MAARKITWTIKTNQERKEILDYWFKRNKSKVFSKKFNKLFIETLKHIAEFDKIQIKVLSVWDSRRDENKLEIR